MPRPKDPSKNAEWRRKISVALTGHPLSEETRKKLSDIRRGRKFSEEHKRKISEAQKGKPRPKLPENVEQERRRKISEAMIGCIRSNETVAKLNGQNNHNWKGGISFEPYCQKFNNEFKERVRAFFGYHCIECGTPQNGRKLHVHHVNFNKMTCCDSSPPLFVPLCISCHMKTNGDREYWENHFTEMIMTKFDGRCYLPKIAQDVEHMVKGG